MAPAQSTDLPVAKTPRPQVGPNGRTRQRVAVIIPAKDEAKRIAATVRSARAIPYVDLVLVVDDGSDDDTQHVAREAGAVVVRHSHNRGKAAAMETGASIVAMRDSSDRPARLLLFIDGEHVRQLVEHIGHTVALAVWGNRGPTVVHWQESPQSVTVNLRLGDVMPLLSSATGRCFAAHVAPDAIAPLLQAEMAHAQKLQRTDVPRTPAELATALAEVRQQGLARVLGTLLPGITGFCAPVFDADGHMAMGMVSLGSAATFDPQWDGAVARPLRAAALQLSSDLGWPGGARQPD